MKVVLGDVVIAESGNAKRLLETSHPATYYVPLEDVQMDLFEPTEGQSWAIADLTIGALAI